MKRARSRVALKRETIRVLKPNEIGVAAGVIDNSEHCITLLVAASAAATAG